MEEVLRCKFCEEDSVEIEEAHWNRIECLNCHIAVYGRNFEETVKKWNEVMKDGN